MIENSPPSLMTLDQLKVVIDTFLQNYPADTAVQVCYKLTDHGPVLTPISNIFLYNQKGKDVLVIAGVPDYLDQRSTLPVE